MNKTLPDFPLVYLRANEQRRLLAGHDWVYSNEIDTKRSPLQQFTAGAWVNVMTAQDHFVGIGYINPNTLIAIRLLAREPFKDFRKLLQRRLQQALAFREKHYALPYYRLVFGESDFLPGIIIDRFADIYVLQINTLGMQIREQDIVDLMISEFNPKAIVGRYDSSSRSLEGLTLESKILYGELPEAISIEENDCRFSVDLVQGQKTGWFFDQRDNRRYCNQYVKDSEILDLFSYSGAWAIQAVAAGAKKVSCIDDSEKALALINKNAELNKCSDRIETTKANIFDVLPKMLASTKRYDMIILDPPALIKRKKDLETGLAAYQKLNSQVFRLVHPGGLVATSSCSYHLSADTMYQMIAKAARHAKVRVQIIYRGFQAADHPVHLNMPETAYLKCLLVRVFPADV